MHCNAPPLSIIISERASDTNGPFYQAQQRHAAEQYATNEGAISMTCNHIN